MVRRAGVSLTDPAAGSVGQVLDVIRDFSNIPVAGIAPLDEDGDGVLAQFGTYAIDGPRRFEVDLTRQFTKRGEDPQIWQLSCTLKWLPSPDTDAIGSGEFWSFGLDLEDFFREVARLDAFQWALTTERAPVAITLDLGRV
jgi:hypothetical protein